MKRYKVNQNLKMLLLLLLTVVVTIIYISERQNDRVQRNAKAVIHMMEVIGLADSVELTAHEFVLAFRDYLISGNAVYTREMKQKQADINRSFSQLTQKGDCDVVQSGVIDSMEYYVNRLYNKGRFADSILSYNPNTDLPAGLIAQIKVDLRAILGQVSRLKSKLHLLEQQEQIQQNITGTRFIFWAKISLFVVLGLLLLVSGLIIYRVRTAFALQATSEKKFITLLESAPDATIIVAADGKIVIANREAIKLLGYSKQEFADMMVEQLMPVSFRQYHSEKRAEFTRQATGRGMDVGQELSALRKDGSVIPVEISLSPIETDDGKFMAAAIRDITIKKHLKDALKKSNEELEEKVILRTQELGQREKQYRYLFENNPLPMWVFDLEDFRFLDVNEMAVQKYGYSREEFLSMTLTDIRPLADRERFQHFDHAWKMNTQDTNRGVWRHCKKNGDIIDVEVIAHPIEYQEKKARLVLLNDVTNRLKTERELQASEKKFRALIENNNDIISLFDADHRITYRSPSAFRITGWSDEELRRKDYMKEIVHPDDLARLMEVFRTALNSPGVPAVVFYRILHRDGHYIDVEGVLINLLHRDYIRSIVLTLRDVTEKKEDEERIRLSNERYEAVAKATSDAIWDFDYKTRRTFIAGTGYRDLFGYDLVNTFSESQFWEERIHPDDYPQVMAKIERVKMDPMVTQSNLEYRFRKADGSWAYLNDRFFIIRDKDGNLLRLLGAKQDITRQKEDEMELIKSAEEKQLLYERLAVILNTLPASVALLDTKGVMVEVNDAWKQFADVNGFSGEEYGIGTSYLTVSTQSFGNNEQIGKDISAGIQDVLDGNSRQFEYEYPWHLPKLNRWFRIVVTPLKGKEFAGAVVMHMDISEIRRLEQERIESRIEEQKKITEAMLKGQEKERNAIGIELHDNVNQILIGTKVLLSVVRDFPEKSGELINSCIDNISLAVQENRKIAHELVTPNLSDENLMQQITRLTQTMLKNAGIITYINHESLNEALLSDELKLALYRVAQEQCTNIIKYSQAEQVIISLATKKDNFFMRIADDGHGTDPKKVTHGIGLKNISSRLSVFGGTISIDTAPEQGFALEIEIPLQPVKAEQK